MAHNGAGRTILAELIYESVNIIGFPPPAGQIAGAGLGSNPVPTLFSCCLKAFAHVFAPHSSHPG